MSEEPPGAVGSRYREDSGADDYWRFQEGIGRQGGTYDLWKFQDLVSPADRVVEFGCGGAFLLERLEAASKTGVEANPVARREAVRRGLDVRAALSDVDDRSADFAYSHHALEHTLDPFGVLMGMRRVLRPGGTLVLWLPVDDWRAQEHATAPDVNGHLWTWTPLLAHNLMAEVGFDHVEATVVRHSWPRAARIVHRNPTAWRVAGRIAAAIRHDRQLRIVARRPQDG